MTLRVQKTDGTWRRLAAQIVSRVFGEVEVHVPVWNERWLICSQGMVGNVGGNAWQIYTLHPDDCAALCGDSGKMLVGRGARGEGPLAPADRSAELTGSEMSGGF